MVFEFILEEWSNSTTNKALNIQSHGIASCQLEVAWFTSDCALVFVESKLHFTETYAI